MKKISKLMFMFSFAASLSLSSFIASYAKTDDEAYTVPETVENETEIQSEDSDSPPLRPMTFEVYQKMFGGDEIQMNTERYRKVHEAGYYVQGIDDIVFTSLDEVKAYQISPYSYQTSITLQATDQTGNLDFPDESDMANRLIYGNNQTGVYTYTTYKTVKYKNVDYVAYCAEMDMDAPLRGEQRLSIVKDAELIKKIHYYGYGGPKSSETDSICSRVAYYLYGTGTDNSKYMFMHAVVSQEYSQRHTWDAAYTDEQAELMEEFVDKVKSLPSIPSSNIWFEANGKKNPENLKTTVYGNIQRTDTIRVCADSSTNSITFTLPESVTCTTGDNKNHTGKVTLKAGTDFYLSCPLTVSGTYSTGNLCGNEEEYQVFAISSTDSKQDVTFGAYYASQYRTNFSVDWLDNGTLSIEKSSADEELTKNNSCYSLEGAVYGVYDTSGKEVARLTTDKNGCAKTTLDAGKYVVKEIKAPKGYYLDKDAYTVTLKAGETYTLKVKDVPGYDPIAILLQKYDITTGKAIPQGDGSLAGAEYTIKYYAYLNENEDSTTVTDPATLGKTPERTWIFKTDEKGFIQYTDSYKVSGDEFYYIKSNQPFMPRGTITIQETKAPVGYLINHTVYVYQIIPDITSIISSWNMPEMPEISNSVTIYKKEKGTERMIPGTEYSHTKPDGTSETLVTDKDGKIVLAGLTQGTHILKETKAVDGYICNDQTVEFLVDNKNEIQFVSSKPSDGSFDYLLDENHNGEITFYNELSDYTLQLIKINDKEEFLFGAEFTIYSDAGCTQVIDTVRTNDEGIAKVTGLEVGTDYYIKETKAPQGYRIPVTDDGKAIVKKIRTLSDPVADVFEYYVDDVLYTGTTGDYAITGTKTDRIVTLRVVNAIGVQLPETGTYSTSFLMVTGIVLMIGAAIVNIRKEKGETDHV